MDEHFQPRLGMKLYALTMLLSLAAFTLAVDFLIGGTDRWLFEAFPLSVLIVAGPIAVVSHVYWRRAARISQASATDVYRRRILELMQFILIIAMILHSIVIVYLLISGHYAPGQGSDAYGYDTYEQVDKPNLILNLGRLFITYVIAGGAALYFKRIGRTRG